MAMKRGADGNIIADNSSSSKSGNDARTKRVSKNMPPLPTKSDVPKEAKSSGNKTQLLGRDGKTATEKELKKNIRTVGDDHTRVVRSRAKTKSSEEENTVQEIAQVVGWLVVINGPGKGASREIGHGNNPIGRSPEATISLNFGDTAISREKHCILTYDPKSRNFFISPGDSRNLVYHNEGPVLAPTLMSSGDKIGLGETLLSFMPFCGEDFDWDDESN